MKNTSKPTKCADIYVCVLEVRRWRWPEASIDEWLVGGVSHTWGQGSEQMLCVIKWARYCVICISADTVSTIVNHSTSPCSMTSRVAALWGSCTDDTQKDRQPTDDKRNESTSNTIIGRHHRHHAAETVRLFSETGKTHAQAHSQRHATKLLPLPVSACKA